MIQNTIEKRNNLLIDVFDESPDLEIKTKGYIIKDLETNWENEVINELKSYE